MRTRTTIACAFSIALVGTVGYGIADDHPTNSDHPKGDHPTATDKAAKVDPGHKYLDAEYGTASPSNNREGKPQQWQAFADDELPADFIAGDSLINVWSAEPGTLTPFVSRDAYASRIYREVLEQLIWTDVETLETVPGLAKSWETTDDGMTHTFHLFENAVFSDGHPVTSDDVIFTYDLIKNEKIDAPITRSYIDDLILSWEALDEHTVQFKMKKKYFQGLENCGGIWVLPKHVYGDFAPEVYNTKIRELCIGSGPWTINAKDWHKGEMLTLRRNENYWGPKPALEKHTIRFIKNGLTRWQDFRAQKVDLIGPTSEQWAEYRDSEKLAEVGETIEYFSPLGGYAYIGFNNRLPKFADKRTRQALTMLIDRDEVIDTLRNGIGNVVTGPFYFQADQYDQTIEPWPFDPDWAIEKLAEAGWEDTDGDGILDQDLDGDGVRDPFEIIFLMPSGGSFGPNFQRYVADKYAVAGIKVLLDSLDWSVFEERLTERSFEMVFLAWTGSSESDPYQIWHSKQAENRGSNHVGFINKESDDAIEAARVELDYDKRMELWHKVHQILHEEQPYTFLFNRPSLAFINSRFKNVHRRPLRLYTSEWYVAGDDHLR